MIEQRGIDVAMVLVGPVGLRSSLLLGAIYFDWQLEVSSHGKSILQLFRDRTETKLWSLSPRARSSKLLSLALTICLSLSSQVIVAQGPAPSTGITKSERQATLVIQLGHSDVVSAVAFSPDGQLVLSGSKDRTARLWDAKTGREIRVYEGHSEEIRSVAFSPDGKYVLLGGYTTGRVLEAETGRELQSFVGESGGLSSVIIPANGRFVLRGGPEKSVMLCEAGSGRELQQFDINSDLLSSGAVSPDGKYLLTADYTAILWDVETASKVREFDGHGERIVSVTFSPDRKWLLTAGWRDLTAKLWETETGTLLRDFYHSNSSAEVTHSVSSVSFSPDGKYVLTVTTDNKAWLWETETGQEVRRFEHSNIVSAAYSPDGKHIITGDLLNTARLWNVETGKEVQRFEGYSSAVSSVAVSHDGNYFLIGNDEAASLWEIGTGSEVLRLAGHSGAISSVALSPNGKYLVTGGFDSTARLWEQTGREVRILKGESKPSSPIKSLTFSPDGKYLLIGDYETAVLWEADTGRRIRNFEGLSTFRHSDLSPDGKHVLGIGRPQANNTDENALVWEVETGRLVQRLNGPFTPPLAISPDGKFALTGETTARLLSEPEVEIRKFEEGKRTVSSGAFSPDGKYLLTGGDGGAARVWHSASGKELGTLFSLRDGTWIVTDPEGRFDTNNLEEIKGLHWIMPDDPFKTLPLEILMRDYYEPRLLPRILKGEQFTEIKDISTLNRLQPQVEIKSILPAKNDPSLVTVTVEVANAAGDFKQGRQTIRRGTEVYDVRLFRDGQIVGQSPEPTITKSGPADLKAWRQSTQVKLDAKGRQSIRFENVRLPRKAEIKEIEFSAYAFNEDRVKSQTDRKTFAIPSDLKPRSGRAYLISVGVNSFESSDLNLQFAANDARVTQELLKQKLVETKQYEEVVQIPLISDVNEKRATKANFKAVLDLLAGRKVAAKLLKVVSVADQIKQALPEDLVIISFSSHGYADDRGTFYLFPTDTGPRIKGRINEQRLISSEELSLWLKDVDAGEMVMIVDACHAAAAVEGSEFKPGPMGSRGLGQLSYDKGMRILTATQAANVAIEAGLIGHGLLTYALVKEGLEEHRADFKPKDQSIALKEWLEYGVERVPKLYAELRSGKVQGINRAELVGSGGGQRGYQQQPSLFDFSRKDREVVLTRISVSDSPQRKE